LATTARSHAFVALPDGRVTDGQPASSMCRWPRLRAYGLNGDPTEHVRVIDGIDLAESIAWAQFITPAKAG
jgi:hypothetical protein